VRFVTTTARLFSRDFCLVVVGTFLFFAAFGASLPVLPRFVVDELGGGDMTVGLVFAAYAGAAVVIRPLVGRIGDRSGRRVLVLLGAALTGSALLGHLLVGSVGLLVLMRVLAGAGQAAVVVGFATLALDLAVSERHGEASSYVMVAVQLGMGFGPLTGELLLHSWSFDAVWVASAIGCLVAFVAALTLPTEGRAVALASRGLFHPAAWRPGIVLGLGTLGFVGFLAFVPLYGEQLGLARVAPLFLVGSGTIALVRVVGAKLPDRLGAVPGATVALMLLVVGLVALGLAPSAWALYAATVVMASGTAILAPSMVLAAVRGVPRNERARVMATFTMFLDIASAVGPAALGVAAARTGYGPTFVVAGGAAGVALLLLRFWLAPRLAAPSAPETRVPDVVTPPASNAVTSDTSDAVTPEASDAETWGTTDAVTSDAATSMGPDARPRASDGQPVDPSPASSGSRRRPVGALPRSARRRRRRANRRRGPAPFPRP
jgi:MFS family permease